MEMFYEEVTAGENGAQTLTKKVVKQRPCRTSLDDVLRVTNLHASNPAMHHVIDKFIELYAVTLQWDWFEQYQSWIERKLFSGHEPVRPELKTIEQYRAEILIDGISVDEYIFLTQRASAVRSITVEVGGLIFDGDEQSQRRMLSAIQAGTDQGMTKTIWRLHNNDEHVVTIEQLKEAHAKAILAQGELWMRKG